MSSILDALKKAQFEEKVKNEQGADRVVWLVPRQKHKVFWRWAGLAALLIPLAGFAVWGISSTLKMESAARRAEGGVKKAKKTTADSLSKSRPPESSRPAQELSADLELSGILWDSQKPYALINAQMVTKGDRVGEAEIIDIKNDAVDILIHGTLQTLSMEKE